GAGACPHAARRGAFGAALMRRHHHVQCAAPLRRRPGRSGRDSRDRRPRHLGIQFAARLGFRVVAVNRGRDKETLARTLGAQEYIDSSSADPAVALRELGGACAILTTVTDAGAMQAVLGGLGANGTMMVIGAAGAITVDSLDLLRKRASVKGWYSGTSVDSEDTLLFSQKNKIASVNEVFPLEQAQAAYERMMSGKA